MAFKITRNLPSNDQITNFYKTHNKNEFNYFRLNDNSLLVCSYNVHGWININANINYMDNFNDIINILGKLNADILVLQEVCMRSKITEDYISDRLKDLGYVDHISVANGGCYINKKGSEFLMVFGKKKFNLKDDIDVTSGRYARHVSIIKYDSLKLLLVHLEIGKRYHHLLTTNPLRKKIEQQNSNMRINELKTVFELHNDIDIIVGDFNFMPIDIESKWLTDNNYTYYGNEDNTTPYNRTDMMFVNNNTKIEVINNTTISCNYSDHLPVLYEINHISH
ncbi:endonuclease/exonuclease/phosphatase family protein [Fadolivirus algeromassiliense]|jgi:endonuclease/exonuclease/phosphatase family metal-dependent hydrolase|uniref:Endonuclease/exonuclease/phosphatase family protein n=1 Tax=Fadolivirus FV1/VV64 TaxID=3070911 RepID=A0A7D3UT24_9VIRU|nr:endonuclease/exonuclease/phosphatase family protein [Fadolivirus algeromassiliense]QKF93990.1 endonuclease/exonuclease/phosphatase family protein [Fadolivirus FV1/VV64]